MKSAIVLLLLSTAAIGQQPAPQPATHDDIVKLFEVMRVRSQVETMQKAVQAQMKPMLEQAMKDETSPAMDPELRDKMQALVLKHVNRSMTIYPVSELLEDFLPVYQKHFTHGDVVAVIAFYTSPAGKRLLDATPIITQEGMTVIMPKMQARMQESIKEMQREADELIEEYHNKHSGRPACRSFHRPKPAIFRFQWRCKLSAARKESSSAVMSARPTRNFPFRVLIWTVSLILLSATVEQNQWRLAA